MSQLTVTQNNAIQKLPEGLKPFIVARQETPIKNLAVNVAKRGLADILTIASFDAGHQMGDSPEILKFQTEALYNEFSGKFGSMTLPEVKEAFRIGIRGEFGQYFGFCPQTYHKFIKSYFDLPERSKAQTEYLALISEETKTSEVPIAIKIEKSKDGCRNAFKEYKESGRMPMCSFAYYDSLCEFIGTEYKGVKTLITNPEVRKKVWTESKEELEKGFLKSKERYELRGDLAMAETIMTKIVGLDKDNQLINRVKEKCLRIFFDSLISNNKELEI